MGQDYTYGVARIRALENTLFTDETINNLLACGDYEECIRVLRDKGWGNGIPNESLESMITEEKNKARHILEDLLKDSEDIRILNINDEFHNLKAAVKQVCTEDETENVFYAGTKYDPQFLKECIRNGNYINLPDNMAEPAKEATEALLRTGDGQLCDIIIDRATLEAIRKTGLQSENELVRRYAETQVMIANIKIAVRGAATGKDSQFVEKCVVPCSGISVTDLIKAVDGGLESVCSYLESVGFEDAVKALKISKSVFECWCDNIIIEDIKPEKYNSFSSGPIIAFYIAKEMEIKNVKIILSGKLNGFDNEFIKERVRLMYA